MKAVLFIALSAILLGTSVSAKEGYVFFKENSESKVLNSILTFVYIKRYFKIKQWLFLICFCINFKNIYLIKNEYF